MWIVLLVEINGGKLEPDSRGISIIAGIGAYLTNFIEWIIVFVVVKTGLGT